MTPRALGFAVLHRQDGRPVAAHTRVDAHRTAVTLRTRLLGHGLGHAGSPRTGPQKIFPSIARSLQMSITFATFGGELPRALSGAS